jgi:hypothetical protein
MRVYVILTSKMGCHIFSKDSKINLTADDSNFISTLKYTGQGRESIYRQKKYNFNPHMNLYKLDEIDFLNKVNEIKVSVTALYKRLNFRFFYERKL